MLDALSPPAADRWDAAFALYQMAQADVDALGDDANDEEYDLLGPAATDAAIAMFHTPVTSIEGMAAKLRVFIDQKLHDFFNVQDLLRAMLADAVSIGRGVMLERTIPHPAALPAPPAAITRILAQFDRRQLEGFIEVAISLLDVADGDPEVEDDDPDSLDGDETDTAWFEGVDQTRTSSNVDEDMEDDDPDEEHDGHEPPW